MLNGEQQVFAASPLTKAMGALARITPDTIKAKANHVLSVPTSAGQ